MGVFTAGSHASQSQAHKVSYRSSRTLFQPVLHSGPFFSSSLDGSGLITHAEQPSISRADTWCEGCWFSLTGKKKLDGETLVQAIPCRDQYISPIIFDFWFTLAFDLHCSISPESQRWFFRGDSQGSRFLLNHKCQTFSVERFIIFFMMGNF